MGNKINKNNNNNKIILYGNHVSTCTNAVKAFLRITNIPYEFKNVDIFGGGNKTEEYKKLNPFGKVPVLVDKELTLRESMVFCRYLVNSRNVGEQLYPKDAAKRALVDLGLEHWSQNTGRFFAIAAKAFGKSDVSAEKAKESVDEAIKELEEVFLKNSKFVAGDQPTLADLPFLFYLLGQSYFTGCNYDEHKRLNQWIDDLYKAEPKLKEQADEYQELTKQAFGKK